MKYWLTIAFSIAVGCIHAQIVFQRVIETSPWGEITYMVMEEPDKGFSMAGWGITMLGDAVYGARTMLGYEPACMNNNKTGWVTPEITESDTHPFAEFGENRFGRLYPNPAGDEVTLDYQIGDGEVGIMELFDLNGKLLKSYPLANNANSVSLVLPALTNGVYCCRLLVNHEQVRIDKLVIVK